MKDLQGGLLVHTDFSDGVNSLEEMAEAARERGYVYLGVADHSQSAHYASGLRLDAIGVQHETIHETPYGGVQRPSAGRSGSEPS